MTTPRIIFRLTPAEVAALRRIATELVPDSERPPNARRDSGWQLTALLRGIAAGVYQVERKDTNNARD